MGPQARDDRDRYWKAFGAWVRKRLSEQTPDRWTQVRLRDELADIGIRVKREWVNQVINGKPPSDDLRRGIERLLGVFPEPDLQEHPIKVGRPAQDQPCVPPPR